MKDLLFHSLPFTQESTGLLNRVLDVMETHNGASRGSEGISCWKRSLEIVFSLLFPNRNDTMIKCVRHHVLVTQVKLNCMRVSEVAVVLSSSHLLKQRTQKHTGKKTSETRSETRQNLQKVACKSSCTPIQFSQVSEGMDIPSDVHPFRWMDIQQTSSSPQRHRNI